MSINEKNIYVIDLHKPNIVEVHMAYHYIMIYLLELICMFDKL